MARLTHLLLITAALHGFAAVVHAAEAANPGDKTCSLCIQLMSEGARLTHTDCDNLSKFAWALGDLDAYIAHFGCTDLPDASEMTVCGDGVKQDVQDGLNSLHEDPTWAAALDKYVSDSGAVLGSMHTYIASYGCDDGSYDDIIAEVGTWWDGPNMDGGYGGYGSYGSYGAYGH